MSQDQNIESGFRSKSTEGLNLLYFLASVHATALTPFIRRGFGINANGWNGFGAMILLLLWCCADPQDALMGLYFLLWIAALVVQKCYTLKLIRQGMKIHSRYGGDPWLAMKVPFMRKDSRARRFEPTMCLLIGVALLPISPALGALWMLGFVTLSMRALVDHAVVDARIQAMDDAELEGRYYSELRQRRGEDW